MRLHYVALPALFIVLQLASSAYAFTGFELGRKGFKSNTAQASTEIRTAKEAEARARLKREKAQPRDQKASEREVPLRSGIRSGGAHNIVLPKSRR